MKIRRGQTEDLLVAVALWEEAQTKRKGTEFLAPQFVEMETKRLGQASSRFLIAQEGDETVGLALYSPAREKSGAGDIIPGLAHISSVAVKPSYWGCGIGRRLMGSLIDELIFDGYSYAQLWTQDNNARAIGLYAALGFQPTDDEKVFEGENIRRYVITLSNVCSPVHLGGVDDDTLEELVHVAVTQAATQEVVPPMPGPPGWTKHSKEWLRDFHRTRRSGLHGPHREVTFSIVQSDAVIGSARLAEVAPHILETGMWLARSVRGRGIGAKVLRLLIMEARTRGAHRMIAHTTSTNAGALGALRNTGALLEDPDADGRIRAQFEISPEPRNALMPKYLIIGSAVLSAGRGLALEICDLLRGRPSTDYVYINQDGTARELYPDERAYLAEKFHPADGARPNIKGTYRDGEAWGDKSGFLLRRRLPSAVTVSAVKSG